jgi:hypothetical protein
MSLFVGNRLVCRSVLNLYIRPSPTQSDIYQMLYWHNSFSWWWARGCSKYLEKWNKWIRIVRQFGYLQGLYQDARSAKQNWAAWLRPVIVRHTVFIITLKYYLSAGDHELIRLSFYLYIYIAVWNAQFLTVFHVVIRPNGFVTVPRLYLQKPPKVFRMLLVIRARSQGSGCTATISLSVHPVF